MYCLWYDQEIVFEISWKNIFFLSKPIQLCKGCQSKLEILRGDRCSRCSRLNHQSVCPDCKWWADHRCEDNPLTYNYSVFAYNETMQEMIAKWKYRGDYILAHAFKSIFIDSFSKKFSSLMKDALIVPIPLSEERLQERGFNQAKVLADFLPIENKEIMTRAHSEKQAKKTRWERISTENPFVINKEEEKINKPVILVDDIYTTGTTLRHAGSLLKKVGCPHIYAYTLIRG